MQGSYSTTIACIFQVFVSKRNLENLGSPVWEALHCIWCTLRCHAGWHLLLLVHVSCELWRALFLDSSLHEEAAQMTSGVSRWHQQELPDDICQILYWCRFRPPSYVVGRIYWICKIPPQWRLSFWNEQSNWLWLKNAKLRPRLLVLLQPCPH